MDYLVVINQIVILFIIIIVGFIASKKNILNSNLNKGLSDLLLNVTLPLLIFTSFNFEFSKDLLKTSLEIFLVSWVIFIFSIFFSNVLFYKYKGEKKDIMRF
ncbi:MAG: AEC family transporter, partial [Clostridiaceae bacterium]